MYITLSVPRYLVKWGSCYLIFRFVCMFCRWLVVLFLLTIVLSCPSSIYGFWLPLWYLQTLFKQDMTVTGCCYRKSPKRRRLFSVFWPKFWRRILAPLMVTYHYVKFYVSIIIHLEVININVLNFSFPIGFYSKPHPLWTPQNMALTPFTTKLKTLGPTRNIYL
jgi:hypothetical protein